MARDPIHPGKFLAGELDALGMSVPQVAKVLHVPANRIYQLLKSQRVLTADTALRLSQWLGTSAEMLRLAEKQAGARRITPLPLLPIHYSLFPAFSSQTPPAAARKTPSPAPRSRPETPPAPAPR